MNDQLALATPYMSLDEVAADIGDGFDAVTIALEQEALRRSERDQEAETVVEFAPIRLAGHSENPIWDQGRLVG